MTSCVQVEEIVTMEDAEFSQIAPVYGLIFLFKWTQDMAHAHRSAVTCVENSNLYFAKQVRLKLHEIYHS